MLARSMPTITFSLGNLYSILYIFLIYNVSCSLLWMPSLVKSATIIFSKLYALFKKHSKRFVKLQAVCQFSGESKAKINYRNRYFHQ